MELLQVIQTADALCPNPYTREEKLRWCDEVSAGIRREIKKIYNTVETMVTQPGELVLPDDICFEDIETAYINGKVMDKLDFRSFAAGNVPAGVSFPAKITLVYLTRAMPVRQVNLKGCYDLSENFIKLDSVELYPGDCIEWVLLENLSQEPDWREATRTYIIDQVYDGLVVEENTFVPQTGAPLAIRRVIDDLTEIDELPYESMYIEYLLAKMALYQRDFTGYSAHTAQYNLLFEGLKRDYKTRAPMNTVSGFRKYWQE
ncbi:MAG: hypothetical protein J6A56_05525 [Clostridia bacterium]|nr:hypothetical protein [Clostridia bacterium]